MPGLEARVAKSTGLSWVESRNLVRQTRGQYEWLEKESDDRVYQIAMDNFSNMSDEQKELLKGRKPARTDSDKSMEAADKVKSDDSLDCNETTNSGESKEYEEDGDDAWQFDPKHPLNHPLFRFCIF